MEAEDEPEITNLLYMHMFHFIGSPYKAYKARDRLETIQGLLQTGKNPFIDTGSLAFSRILTIKLGATCEYRGDWRQMLFDAVAVHRLDENIIAKGNLAEIRNKLDNNIVGKCNNLLSIMAKTYPKEAEEFFNLQKENAHNAKIKAQQHYKTLKMYEKINLAKPSQTETILEGMLATLYSIQCAQHIKNTANDFLEKLKNPPQK